MQLNIWGYFNYLWGKSDYFVTNILHYRIIESSFILLLPPFKHSFTHFTSSVLLFLKHLPLLIFLYSNIYLFYSSFTQTFSSSFLPLLKHLPLRFFLYSNIFIFFSSFTQTFTSSFLPLLKHLPLLFFLYSNIYLFYSYLLKNFQLIFFIYSNIFLFYSSFT